MRFKKEKKRKKRNPKLWGGGPPGGLILSLTSPSRTRFFCSCPAKVTVSCVRGFLPERRAAAVPQVSHRPSKTTTPYPQEVCP